ncbi:MAG: BCCT family transporter, partial [Legionellales bacterium]|nr:BCCT family transporter [Legionellales bacterium]
TIREFILGVLFIPTIFTFLWITVLGNSSINIVLKDNAQALIQSVHNNMPIALFKFLDFFPFTFILSIISLILVVTFFVSSSDSGSLVIDTLASGGNDNPPVWQKIFWSIIEGIVAAILLITGGLNALQAMTILSALPILCMILIGAYSLIKSLQNDRLLHTSVHHHNTVVQYSKASTSWKERLEALTKHPQHKEVNLYIQDMVFPALQELKNEMCNQGLEASLEKHSNISVTLTVKKEGADDFYYEVRLRSFCTPEFAVGNNNNFCRAEVFLSNGGQDYDIFGYNQHQIIADALTQYEKHFHFLHRSTFAA